MEITSVSLRTNKVKSGRRYRGIIKYRDESSADGFRQMTKTFDPMTVKTKSQAVEALERWRREVEAMGKAPDAALTVVEYIDRYIDGLEKTGSIEASTVTGYRKSLRYIERRFSRTALRDLQARDIQQWESELTSEGLSSSTVGKAHRLLKQACSHAVDVEDLTRNPCNPVKPPKRTTGNPNALDADGRDKALKTLGGMELTSVVVGAYIAMFTGMREGEICALSWGDVDLDKAEIRVSRSIGTGKGGTYIKTPKTSSSRRTIPMPDQLVSILKRLRDEKKPRWQAARLTLGMPATDADFSKLFVIGGMGGEYYSPTLLGREWAVISKNAGLVGTEGKRCSFHDLRHSFATLAIAEGADVKSVSSILGHSNAAMTLNVYASADAEAKRRTANIVNTAMVERPSAEVITMKTGTEA